MRVPDHAGLVSPERHLVDLPAANDASVGTERRPASRQRAWREEARGLEVGARLVDVSRELERIAPAVSRWLRLAPGVRGAMPEADVGARARVPALLAELAELACADSWE